jgi:hypothetical protein
MRYDGWSGADWPAEEAIMRATVSIAFVLMLLTATEAAAGSWCATYTGNAKGGSENCTFTSFDQCRAQVSGVGGWCRPNPFPSTAFGTGGTWSSGPRR